MRKSKARLDTGKLGDFDARNLRLAREILDNPAIAGGPDSFAVKYWAPAVIERLGNKMPGRWKEQQPAH